MKKDILLIAHFCSDFDGKGNNRFNYLANLIAENDFDIELITSDFSHNKKKKRDKVKANAFKYKITYISEPIYTKNVSTKRFFSHYIMGLNLKKYLTKRKRPDIIYCAVPSLDVAKTAAKYAQENNIKFIIDVQDLWPEAFSMILNLPVISDLLFYHMQRKANYIYATADEIIAVSDTYKDRALKVNNKSINGHSIFLGTELAVFDKMAEDNKYQEKPENEIWVAYIGTLGHSYDLTSVIDALEIVKRQGNSNMKFIVMGDGPLKSKYENYAKAKGIYVQFTGRLEYCVMVGILSSCDIAVNPIKGGSAGSIINKVGDYAASGLPVINTQECIEYRELLERYQAGINCNNNDGKDLASKLLYLYKEKELRETMGKNSRKLAEEKFDRGKAYLKILDILNSY